VKVNLFFFNSTYFYEAFRLFRLILGAPLMMAGSSLTGAAEGATPTRFGLNCCGANVCI